MIALNRRRPFKHKRARWSRGAPTARLWAASPEDKEEEWLEGDHEPELFELDMVNKQLSRVF
jgi:hypothetical protein